MPADQGAWVDLGLEHVRSVLMAALDVIALALSVRLAPFVVVAARL